MPQDATTGPDDGSGSRRGPLIAAVVVFVALVAGAGTLVLLSNGDDDTAGADDSVAFCRSAADLEGSNVAEDRDAYLAAVEEMAASAPAEIREDVARVAEITRDIHQTLEQAEQEGDHDAVIEAALAPLFEPENMEIGNRIDTYLVEHCEVDPGESPAGGAEAAASLQVMGIAEDEVKQRFEEIAEDLGDGAEHFSRMGTDRLTQLILTVQGEGEMDDATLAMAVCEELSAFLAGHPDADGEARLEVARTLANATGVNEEVRPGDAGSCEEGQL